jgi:Ca-activated chloride channel family protein
MMEPRWGRVAALAVVVGLLLSPVGAFQEGRRGTKPAPITGDRQAGRPGQEDEGPQIEAELVLLDVSVIDKANRPVFDLAKERFQVSEDGVTQQIAFFDREETAVSLALVIDTSGTMRSKLETVVQAVTNLVRADKPEDEVAVIQFKDQIELLEEFTTDEREVEDALGDLVAHGQTALLDAVLLSSDYVQKEGRRRRKALLVVTDGLEEGSYYTYDQVAERLRQLDVRLYFIGFTNDLDQTGSIFRKSPKKNAETLLGRLAEESGGRAFFPADVSEVGAISDEIARDLRTVYAIGYYPTNDKRDGTFRKVSVKIPGDSKYSVRTRTGYYATK